MNTVWIVVGLGPNSVEVPALWFPTKEAAADYVTKIFGVPRENKKGLLTWEVDETKEHEELLRKHIYTGYYGGCGSCYRLVLQEVKSATPFVAFDLD